MIFGSMLSSDRVGVTASWGDNALKRIRLLLLVLGLAVQASASASGSGLLGTGGATSIEGGGGGIIPWATLNGYAEDREVSLTGSFSLVHLDDFDLRVLGASVNYRNRLELSVADQRLQLSTLGGDIRQQVFGAKLRLGGDLIYGTVPQIALGVQYKRNRDFAVPGLLQAARDDDFEAWLGVARAWLDGPFHRTWLIAANARATRANQTGLLGFGGDDGDSHEIVLEGALVMFLNRSMALGVEYRQKPDNLSAVNEDDWMDVFFAWFPNKSLSLVAGWTRLGDIAGFTSQDGPYFSVELAF